MSGLRLVANCDLIRSAKPKDKSDSFSVTAIGSCRIVGPLRLMQQAEPVILNQSGVYGYSHSCTELRQHLTHLSNGTRPPQDLMPVLSPKVQKETKPTPPHTPSDFYIFELSSAKLISVDGHPVQLNYLNRHFCEFFSDTERTRAFWRHAKFSRKSEMETFLANIPEFRALSGSDQRILRLLELRDTTPEQLRLDIDAIRAAAPDHLFVTHFDAYAKDGKILQARADYLKMVRNALIDCGVAWFDPTKNVAAFGQDLALDDPEKSLSHFSHSFEQFLSNNWWLRFINPVRKERQMDANLRVRLHETALATTPSLAPHALHT